MDQVIDMNNHGADLLEGGQYEDALRYLSGGLERLQQLLEEADETYGEDEPADARRSEPTTAPSERDVRSPSIIRSASEKAIVMAEQTVAREESSTSVDHDFIYRRPIYITSEFDGDDETTISVILVFNMALSHHLRAIDTENDNPKRLKGALKLYELGFSMQLKGEVRLSMTHTLALVNNCSQVYKKQGKDRKAAKFLKHLLATLMIMVETGEIDEIDEIDGFMGNTSSLILVDRKFAAAA